jgi:AbiV family abortive infection protein
MVSESLLLEGSWYALEQAGRLLRAAVGLFDDGDPATGLVLAMLGREEIGRSRILRRLADEAAAGVCFEAADVTKQCEDHVTKQRAGTFGTTLRVVPSSQLAAALQTSVRSAPGSTEQVAARKVIRAASEAKAKRDPQDRHDLREVALYVDLDPSGTTWSRPCAVASTDARAHIEDAVGDYAIECDALRDEVIENDFPKMAKARAAMNPAPILLEATWPTLMGGI